MNKKSLIKLVSFSLVLACAVGASYALMKEKSETDIVVTDGNIEINATLNSLKTYSADATLNDGDVVPGGDNLGDYSGTYYYKELSDGAFSNGGSAKIENGQLKLTNMTPGDKASVKINIENNSNVSFKYRVVFESNNESMDSLKLFSILNFKAFDLDLSGAVRYATDWELFDLSKASISSDIDVIFPLDGEAFPNATCNAKITVEAVQANAITNNEEPLYVNFASEVVEKLDDETYKDVVVGDENVNVNLNLNNNTIKVLKESGEKVEIGEGEVLTLKVQDANAGNFVVENGFDVISYEIELCNSNGEKIVSLAEDIELKMLIGSNLVINKVYHNGVELNPSKYSYDGASGYLTILTDSFSPFAIVLKTCNHTADFNNKLVATCSECHATRNILINDGVTATLEQSNNGYFSNSDTSSFEWINAVDNTLIFTDYAGSAVKTDGFKTLTLEAGKTYVTHIRVTNIGIADLEFEAELDSSSINPEILAYLEISYTEVLKAGSWMPSQEILAPNKNEVYRIYVKVSADLPANLSGLKISNLPISVKAVAYTEE